GRNSPGLPSPRACPGLSADETRNVYGFAQSFREVIRQRAFQLVSVNQALVDENAIEQQAPHERHVRLPDDFDELQQGALALSSYYLARQILLECLSREAAGS